MQLRDVVNSKPVVWQQFTCTPRAHEDGKTYSFVAATERAVDTPFGPEVLRMSGVRLKRYRSNPVVLDSHNRYEAGAVVGRAEVKKQGSELLCDITFANTDRAQQARQLVEDGFLRAVSVGFVPNPSRIRRLRAGETDGDVEGPARIVQEWELIEISVVPVPADADALARSFYFGDQERQESAMQYPESEAASAPAVPAVTTPTELPEEIEARRAKAVAEQRSLRHTEIRSLGEATKLTDLAGQLILEDVTVDVARERFKAEIAKRSAPINTPEPAPVAAPNPDELTDAEAHAVLRALGSTVEVR